MIFASEIPDALYEVVDALMEKHLHNALMDDSEQGMGKTLAYRHAADLVENKIDTIEDILQALKRQIWEEGFEAGENYGYQNIDHLSKPRNPYDA